MNMAVTAGSTNSALRFPWRWIVAGVVMYLLFLIATFPAARVASKLQANGVQLAGVSGSIWNGSAGAVQASGIILGPTDWHISPWRLFIGTLSADIHSKRDDGYADATVRIGFGGALSIRNFRGSLPVSALAGIGLPGGANGWAGTIQLKMDELTFANRWPSNIKGTIEIANLVGPAQQPTQLGSYRISFPAPNSSTANGELQGAVVSMEDAPLDVAGAVRLSPNHTYVIDAQVATRPSAPASIVKALQYLGPPDAQGRRPLSVAGSL
jgi:general secretion pathway protein N